ncbi:LTA synthase family protein [Mucilaginibacter sp. BJC16-A38]|uniref:LTA synthase family protein n=1 Tax=Mucilaginibacter phenanthrenivorans TaxID=1234842 RepID=UPI0021574043|nr:LTA synthase family protein [Mucilaginibacter phenanthrenivorans]MCR8561087.1 LTA synthase family protein [Mucilaginibacter phenanthrenivorans]
MKKLILVIVALGLFLQLDAQTHKTQNVIIVTLDGFRWQELYRGADSALINSNFTKDKKETTKRFWAATAAERRKILLPFFWNTIAQKGQLYGDRDAGGKDEVANPYHFSYPGYNEIFTGFPDVRMNTNDPIPNPNMNVLEYLNKQPGFKDKIAVFTSWQIFPAILSAERSGLPVNSGYADFKDPKAGDRLKYLNDIQHKVPEIIGPDERLDFLTFEFSKEYIKQYKPRVLYMGFDETDDLAHDGNYQLYLQSAQKEDGFLGELWQYLQTDPQYKDKTTLIITCDHGRGDVPLQNWRDHGTDTPHSGQTWFAVIGPDTPAKGIITGDTTTYHKQLAQTISKLLGLDFKAAAGHEVGEPVNTVLGK